MKRSQPLVVLFFCTLLLVLMGHRFGGDVAKASPALQFTSPLPTPYVSFSYWPNDPSLNTPIWFNTNSYDPLGIGIQSWGWNFGDNTTGEGPYINHQYTADGDYTVTHSATTYDGRSGSSAQVVRVRTRDVAILKFTRPKSGRVGDTKRLIVGINSKRYPETVVVELYKSDPTYYEGFRSIGWLEQTVPVLPNNKTVDFYFSYTFTAADAAQGTVVFKAVARIANGMDSFPADNTAISPPIAVSGGVRAAGEDEEMVEELFEVSTQSPAAGTRQVFLPLLRQ